MFPRHELSWLRRRYGRRMILKGCKSPRHTSRGSLITLHQPDIETLLRLVAMAKQRFMVSAAHIAVDLICPDQGQAKHAAAFLGRAIVQKWHRRNHFSHRERNTHYWRRGRSTRNIAVYGDRQSKTGEGPCCHVEMRFTGAAACKRAGLDDLNHLLVGPDVFHLLHRQARLAPIDPKRLDSAIERKARRCLRGTQRRHPEITVAELKTKIWTLVTRILQDEDSSFDERTVNQARSQSLLDYRPELRAGLNEIKWSEFAPPVRWHAWRYTYPYHALPHQPIEITGELSAKNCEADGGERERLNPRTRQPEI